MYGRRVGACLILAALLATMVAISGPVEAAPNKAELCHHSSDGTYFLISVSGNGNAVTAHVDHGDGFPGAAVPDMPGYSFDAACGIVPDTVGCVIGGEPVETVITQPECDALVDLYNSTNGPSWISDAGWLTPTDPCGWHGLVCQSGALTGVGLSSNGLSGTIPASIGDLSNLTLLRLAFNSIGGTLPAAVGNLAMLVDFQLNNNLLTGTIPASIGNLSNLVVLRMNVNQFSGSIPPELGNLISVEFLELYSNSLTGSIPPELGNLSNVRHFRVEFNQLSGSVPVQVWGLASAEIMRINDNLLTGSIPAEVGLMVNLTQLVANSNQFSGELPAEIGNLDSVTVLRLNTNELSGVVPATIQDLGDTLTELRLNNNLCLTADVATEAFVVALDPNWDNGCP